ncbi:MAG: glmS [Mucilaginibacter sp.]|nr:glmS [Mucilaginibacter sp.]
MCGIIGYIGHRDVYPVLIKGLHRLEYRGYDSAGIAVIDENDEKILILKKSGKVRDLEEECSNYNITSKIGIGHTRWATHGAPNDTNSHPHHSENKKLALVHNGIIENYHTIKEALLAKGHSFVSETDTEVLVHLIEEIQLRTNMDLQDAVRSALKQVIGAYAIVIIDKDNPGRLIAARKGSPLVIGVGTNEFFIASDATPIIEYTRNIIYLNDDDVACIDYDGINIANLNNVTQVPFIHELQLEIESLEKGNFDHFMLKEIYEQSRSVKDCMRGRIYPEEGRVELGGIKQHAETLKNIKRIIIVSCGSSWHAGLIGEYLIEKYTRISVEVEYASEFRYRDPIVGKDDLVIAISQSGETADTLAAVDLAKKRGAHIWGICNVVGSSLARVTDAGIYTHAGPEIGVASTKAFTAQVAVLTLLTFYIAQQNNSLQKSELIEYLTELNQLPELIETCLKCNEEVMTIAQNIYESRNCIFLGRGSAFPVALEGALKLKEISYIHAEGYPAAEMKHGPIALIDQDMPVVFIATNHSSYEKVINNIQEVKARKGIVIAIVTDSNAEVRRLADYVIEIPHTSEVLLPILATIPLQLLSYHIAILRGCNVDQPRNLAKSVTVE